MAEEKSRPINSFCKNIFRAGEKGISKADFTKKWIELINMQERNKNITVNQ